jgi:hypothetical protein
MNRPDQKEFLKEFVKEVSPESKSQAGARSHAQVAIEHSR